MDHQNIINSAKTTGTVKRYIMKHSLMEYKCSECGLSNKWNNKELVLHIHHKNGNHIDNNLNNLQFICPNCHSQTNTYCGRGAQKEFPCNDKVIEAIKISYSIAEVLRNLNLKITDYHAYRKIKSIIKEYKLSLLTKLIKPKQRKVMTKFSYIPKTKYPYPDIETMKKLVWERSPYQLAKEWGIRDTTIRYWCQRRGIKLPPVGYWRKKETGNL